MNGPSQPPAAPRGHTPEKPGHSRLKPTLMIGAAVALALVAGGATIWLGSDDGEPVATPVSTGAASGHRDPESPAARRQPQATTDSTFSMAAMPRPDHNEESAPAPEPDLSVPFEIEDIANALSNIELDEEGMPVLNETTREILDTAFMRTAEPMTESELNQLQSLIKAGLEGDAGARAAEIAGRYYRYSQDYRAIADTLEMQGGNPEALRANFEQVSILRRSHLGEDVAQHMFGQEEALTRYTLDAMTIQSDPELTPEQKADRQKALRESADGLREAGLVAAPAPEPEADPKQTN